MRAADAFRDLRVFLTELRRHGNIAFARFPVPPAEQVDHYRTMVSAYTELIPRTRLDHAPAVRWWRWTASSSSTPPPPLGALPTPLRAGDAGLPRQPPPARPAPRRRG
ncbi:MAG: hypothetical protein FJW86_12520 [Actinobacteria bacterium]|nr:hypothetical protein [Actinomycetota bacterium]